MCFPFSQTIHPRPARFTLAGMLLVSAGISQTQAQQKLPTAAPRAVEVSPRWNAAETELTMLEIDAVASAGAPGKRSKSVRELRAIAASAWTGQSVEVWAAAELAAVRQFLTVLSREEDELILLEPIPLLDSVLRVVTEHQFTALRVEVLEMLAECRVAASQDELAAKTLERAATGAQSIGETDWAMRQLLTAARIYRNLGHTAKLRILWIALDDVFQRQADQLDLETVAAMEAERLLCLPALDKWPVPQAIHPVEATLQPAQSRVDILADGSEDGRCRMLLANNSAVSIFGKLTLTTQNGSIPNWQFGENGHVIEIQADASSEDKPAQASKTLNLGPWQRIRLFLKCESKQEQTNPVTVTWTSGETELRSVVHFSFANENAAKAEFIEQSASLVAAGAPVPIYHHLYYRGEGASVENFLLHSSLPGRVEVYQEETGVLIAIDAEGDGRLDGSEDYLNSDFDADENSIADFKLSERNAVEDLEIYALPADPTASATDISLYLAKQEDGRAYWSRSSEDKVEFVP